MIDESPELVPFDAHVELLRAFLAHRGAIVGRVEGLLNAQRRPAEYLHDRPLLSRHFEDCFFTLPAVTSGQARLRGKLEEAHWASGFKPRHVPELHNDLVHPAEMMSRAFYCWQQTRWPGRNGRVRYAETLFNLYLLRCLELLSMRVWDAGAESAGDRLAEVQRLLDELWDTAPSDQPVLVRDARWLIPLAQSPTTDELGPYFDVAKRVAESLAPEDRNEIQRAHVLMIGGHLRSQIRHYCIQDGVSLNHESVVRRTRTSNALDFALLIQHLVPLLEAYAAARDGGDHGKRLELAGVICQAVSPDPELFVNRIDLLGAYSMIEHLFTATDRDGRADYTAMGRRHVERLREYAALVDRLSGALCDDCSRFRPVDGAYSPCGVFYGTPSNLTEHIAFKTIQRDAVTRFGLEDVFTDGDADKIAWVNGWRELPHIDREVQNLHAYPHSFATEIFDRIEHALQTRADGAGRSGAVRTGRLHIAQEGEVGPDPGAEIPDLPARYVASSDDGLVAEQKAALYEHAKLLRDLREGHFIVSYETPGGWVAIKKDMLTEVLGAGRDAKVVGLPPEAAARLRLMCPHMLAPEGRSSAGQASAPPSMLNA